MAISASSFTGVKKIGMGPGRYMVTGVFTGPASYAGSGGEQLTLALVRAAFRGLTSLESLEFANGVRSDTNLHIQAAWDHNPTAGTDHGSILCFNVGQSPHSHTLSISGGVTGGDAVRAQDQSIGAANAKTIPGGTSGNGVQNSTATAAASEVTTSVNLSSYKWRFTAFGR